MKGIIVQNSANLYNVVELNSDEASEYVCTARGKFKNDGVTPVVGDKVEFSKDTCSIEKVLDRSNYIKRPRIANITQIAFVISMKDPVPDLLLLDKQLAFASMMNVKAIIIINKCDLANKSSEDEISDIYTRVGYTVIETEAKMGIGIDILREKLLNQVTVFSGNSGVGKSTIINGLFEKNITEEGLISEKNKRGKNTTTLVKLYELCDNTFIADTPGFSTFEISEIDYKVLDKEFIEFNDFIGDCRYVGCSHINESEKDCNVKKAVLENMISKSRYDNYCKIYNELKDKKKY